jgi:hypothetical protein
MGGTAPHYYLIKVSKAMCGKPHIALAESNNIIVYSAKLYYNLIKTPKYPKGS